MPPKQQFFSKIIPKNETILNKQNQGQGYTPVGGLGDNLFICLSAALIDRFSLYSFKQGWDNVLAQIISSYDQFYSSNTNDMAPVLRMQQWVKHVPMKQLIPNIAYTCRQLAVDELCTNPHLYSGAFIDKEFGAHPAILRQRGTVLHESALAALSNKLDLAIILEVSEQDKILPCDIRFNQSSENTQSILAIQRINGIYLPYLQGILTQSKFCNEDWIYSDPLPLLAVDPSYSDIMLRIITAQNQLMTSYNKTRSQLQEQIIQGAKNGDFSRDDLVQIYTQAQLKRQYRKGQLYFTGFESGTQPFFEDMMNLDRQIKSIINHDDYLTHQLIQSMARAICLGYLDYKEKPCSSIQSSLANFDI